MEQKYDVLIMTTARDFLRLKSNYHRLVRNIPNGKLIFVGNAEVGELAQQLNLGERVGFINEDDILPFTDVHRIMQDVLQTQDVPRGVTGWYYQQFLKMQYCVNCEDEYYLVWDGDTIPCKPFTMFSEDGVTPLLDLKREYHEEYFVTLEKLLPGMHKCIEASFISEHMLMKCEIMKQLIGDIMKNPQLKGETFYERIIRCIDKDKLVSNSFSEFETYGTYVCFKYLGSYRLRNWHSFRYAGYFFRPDEISDSDYQWLGKDFDAVSFEKGNEVREDHDNLFNNKEYQEKLSARQMLEIAQEDFEEGYLEMWMDENKESAADKEGKLYGKLGDIYLQKNIDQAYLCYENAEYLCSDVKLKEEFSEKKDELLKTGQIAVKPVSFVIVSYNSQYLTQKCIESIRESCNPKVYKIVVVDNASTDGVAEWLQNQKDISVIINEENEGFPKGCNIGIAASDKINDVLLLNNDTRMTPNALFWLRMGLYENTEIGATGCVANYCGNNQQIDVVFATPGEYVEYGKSINVYNDNPYEERNRLCGFAMLLRRVALDAVGVLDENLSPGFFEDDDISIRLRREGYRLLVCHNSFIYHAGSQSFSKRIDVDEILQRNNKYLINKWQVDIWNHSLMNEEAVKIISERHQQDESFTVLEVGAGCGSTLSRLKYLFPKALVCGIEKEELAVEYASGNVEILVGDWKTMNLPFKEHVFDYIIHSNRDGKEVDDELLMSRLERYVQEDGMIIDTALHTSGVEGINLEYYGNARTDLISMITSEKSCPLKVLEIGCGTGATLLEIKEQFPNAQVYGVELQKEVAEYGAKTLPIICGNIEDKNLTYPKESFDYIVLGDVIEHLINPEETLSYLKQFLKEDGCIIASIPNILHYSAFIPLLFGEFNYSEAGILDRTHLRFFTWRSIYNMFERVHCEIVEVRNNEMNDFMEPWIEEIISKLCNISTEIDRQGFYTWQYCVKVKKR